MAKKRSVSVRSRSIEMSQNWLEIAVPSPFSKEVIGTAVLGGMAHKKRSFDEKKRLARKSKTPEKSLP